MIHESAPWKAHLSRDAELIERWAAKPTPSERRSFLIERKVFLAAYAMRKLDDARKLSTDLLSGPLEITRFPPTRQDFSGSENHRFERFFDLGKPLRQTMPARRVLNLLVHSLVFVEVLTEAGTCDAFMVTSDHESTKGLARVAIADFVHLMRRAANDFPSCIVMFRDESGRERYWAGHGAPPPEFNALLSTKAAFGLGTSDPGDVEGAVTDAD